MNKEDAKKRMELQLLQQYLQQLQEQFNILQSQLLELKSIKDSIDELKTIKNQKAIVPLGAGIFLESNLSNVEEVFLNVGANVIIKKDIDATKKLLEDQVRDLEKISLQIENNITRGVMQLQESQDLT